MPDPARPPLVVLPEACVFPPGFAAPWTRDADARAFVRDPADDRAPFGAVPRIPEGASTRGRPARESAARTIPIAPLPRPLVPLASDPDAPGRPRDPDAEVGAHPDTLRALGMCAGDLVAVRSTLGGATRLARLVAAERYSAPAHCDSIAHDHTDEHSENPSCRVVPGALYVPPGARRALDLHIQLAVAAADAIASGSGPGGAPTVTAPTVTVTVTRVVEPAPRARAIVVAPARVPAPLIPSPPSASDPWARGGAVENAVSRRFQTPRLVAPGDVFAVVIREPIEGAECAEEDGGAEYAEGTGADRVGATRRRVFRVAVKSVDAEFGDAMSSAEGTSAEASAEWTSCAMVGAIAAGGPSPGLERFALCDDSNSRNPGAVPKGARDDDEDEEDDELRLSPLAASLVAALAPPLHVAAARALRLRTAILVHGSAGMGKRGAVAAAASALGAAFVPVSCHELVAEGGERRLAAAVDAAFEAAAAHAPVVLYLRRFGALAGAASASGGGGGGGGPGEISGGAAAAGVARSIRKGIAASSADSSSATSDDHDDEEDRAELERHVRHRAEGEPSREGTGPDARGLVVLVAGVEDLESVPEPLRRCFTHEVEATPPTEAERLAILRECLGPGREPSDREDETVVARGTPRSAAARSAAKSEDRTPRMRGTPETPGTPGTPRMPGSSGVPGMSLGTSPVATAPSSSPVPDFPDFPGTPRASTSSPRPFSARDLESAAASSSGASPRDVRALAAEAALSAPLGTPITSANLADAVRWSERRTASAIGAPTVPATTWEDVGGLEDVKAAIRDVVELPLKRPDLFAARAGSNSGGVDGRSGALLYGPPGTGKTLLAKAVATECAIRFLSVKGPELVNMYVGESERNVREVFERARHAAPCVVFFDELDALAPARGAGADSGGVMDRVVSQLLAELDGAHAGVPSVAGSNPDRGKNLLFVVGATNRPDLVDPALLRPGRFDRLLYVGVDATPEGRLRVLRALTKRFAVGEDDAPRSNEGTLASLARRVPARFTGADMYALCADAWMRAAKRTVAEMERDGNAGAVAARDGEEFSKHASRGESRGRGASSRAVIVLARDFDDALAELSPSLTDADVAHYARMRENFEGSRRGGGR